MNHGVKEIYEFLVNHHLLLTAASGIGTFFVGLFLGEPLKRWWINRGTLREIREQMYESLAEFIYVTQIHIELRAKFANPDVANYAIRIFYEQVDPKLYSSTLEAVGKERQRMGLEAIGMLNILSLLDRLPGPQADLQVKVEEIDFFINGLLRELAIASFDSVRLTKALARTGELGSRRRTLEFLHQLTATRDAIEDSRRAHEQLTNALANREASEREIEALQEERRRERAARLAKLEADEHADPGQK
jgi:hypothetical protein